MIKDLIKLATRLDNLGLTKEADVLDAAAVKLAQQVATTGVAGATYSAGRQTTPGKPGGVVAKFYKAKPKSISEFNTFLGALITDISMNNKKQTAFSRAVLSNIPSQADTTWGPKTQKAFSEYAVAAGVPEAGRNWESWSKKNMYEPTMNGIFRFWEDTIDKVIKKFPELERGASIEFDNGPKTDLEETNRFIDEMSKQKGGPGFSEQELRDLGFTEDEIKETMAKRQRNSESAAAAGATGTRPINDAINSPWFLSNNREEPLQTATWKISEADKKRLSTAWESHIASNPGANAEEWVRSYIIKNAIPGGWNHRGPDGRYTQAPMAAINAPPALPAFIDPRDLDKRGGNFKTFKDELERFPKGGVIFVGWSLDEVKSYLAKWNFDLVGSQGNYRLIDKMAGKTGSSKPIGKIASLANYRELPPVAR